MSQHSKTFQDARDELLGRIVQHSNSPEAARTLAEALKAVCEAEAISGQGKPKSMWVTDEELVRLMREREETKAKSFM